MTEWTEERRRKQAEAIRRWKPWEKSTGPKTQKGKDASRMNALKHGGRSAAVQDLIEALRHQKAFADHLVRYLGAETELDRKAIELYKNREKSDE